MVITAHFIDAVWELKKLIIGFKYVQDHKGSTIAAVLLECLVDWGIKKIFTITCDNATKNTSALRIFQQEFSLVGSDYMVLSGEFMHMRCASHIINLIVKDGLHDLGDNVEEIHNAIYYVRSSIPRLKSFEMRVDTTKMTRGSLPLDVKTRWNSTYLMLSKALKFRVAFDKMMAEDKLYSDYFLEVDNGSKKIGPPFTTDWNVVDRLVKFLVIFYRSTLVVSASTSVSSYKCYGMKNVNKALIVATIFDPRKKMQFAKLCFDKLYGVDSPEAVELYKSVQRFLWCMFKEYTARSNKGTSMVSSQSYQNSSFGGQEDHDTSDIDLVGADLGYESMDSAYKTMVDETGVADTRDELEIYLKEAVENPKIMVGSEFNVLS